MEILKNIFLVSIDVPLIVLIGIVLASIIITIVSMQAKVLKGSRNIIRLEIEKQARDAEVLDLLAKNSDLGMKLCQAQNQVDSLRIKLSQ